MNMGNLNTFQEARKTLMLCIKSVEKESGQKISETDLALILSALDTTAKMRKFAEWGLSKVENDTVKVTIREMVRASTIIDRGETDLP